MEVVFQKPVITKILDLKRELQENGTLSKLEEVRLTKEERQRLKAELVGNKLMDAGEELRFPMYLYGIRLVKGEW